MAAQGGVISTSSPKLTSQAERFKRDEAAFLSKSPQQLQQSAASKSSPKAKRDREELERFLDSMQPLSAKSGMGNSLLSDESSPTSGALQSVDEKSSSGSFAPLSPRSAMGGNGSPSNAAPPSSRTHTHARRPSFMQPTEQELARQAELREANQARERKQEEERQRAARRAQGVTSTDLYIKQQAELEAKRLAGLEKEQAERAAERARFLAKYEAENLPGPATERTARPRPQQLPSPTAASSGSQTSRAAASSATAASSSSSALQAELQRREEILRRDAQQGFHATTDDTDSSDDDADNSDSDTTARVRGAASDDEDDEVDAAAPAAHGRRKGKTAADLAARKQQQQKGSRRQEARGASIASGNATPLLPGVAHSRHMMLSPHSVAGAAASSLATAAAPAAASSASARTHRAAASSSSVTNATAAALAAIGIGSSDDSAGSDSDGGGDNSTQQQRRPPATIGLPFATPALSSSADIYDPALARRAAAVGLSDSSPLAAIASDPITGAPVVTGMDLLIRSKKFRKAKAEAERKGRTDGSGGGADGVGVNSSFGRLTAAQLERQMDQVQRKKALESKQAAEGPRGNHAHAVEQAQAAQQAKKSFFPNMFRSKAN